MTVPFSPLEGERLGPLLRRRMHERGLLQKDVRLTLGVSGSAVYGWVNDLHLPNENQLESLARYLYIPKGDIFTAANETAASRIPLAQTRACPQCKQAGVTPGTAILCGGCRTKWYYCSSSKHRGKRILILSETRDGFHNRCRSCRRKEEEEQPARPRRKTEGSATQARPRSSAGLAWMKEQEEKAREKKKISKKKRSRSWLDQVSWLN